MQCYDLDLLKKLDEEYNVTTLLSSNAISSVFIAFDSLIIKWIFLVHTQVAKQ